MSPRRFSRPKVLSLVFGAVSIYWFPFWQQTVDYLFPAVQSDRLWQPFEFHVHARGYKHETHRIRTTDGYEIEFHRVWNPNVTGQRESFPVVLGPLCFLISKLHVVFDDSPAYTFADAGFDVWLLNHRGSTYGLKHVKLDPWNDRGVFYNYTLITFAEIDIPQQIDHILEVTGQPKIFLAAYSQAVMALFAMLSRKPAFQEKIGKAIAYAGAKTPCHLKYVDLLKVSHWIGDLLHYSGLGHIGRFGWLLSRSPYFNRLIDYSIGMDLSCLKESQKPLLNEFRNEGTGIKVLLHMAQNAQPGCDGELRDFDYDFGMITQLLMRLGLRGSKNMEIYGTPEPPVLNVENVSFPMKFYFSDGDGWATETAVTQLAEKLKIPAHDVHRIADERFNHFHFHFLPGTLHLILHAVDFFKGEPSAWNPHIYSETFDP